MKLFKVRKALPSGEMDGAEGVPLQDEAALFQVTSTEDMHSGHISKLPHEP